MVDPIFEQLGPEPAFGRLVLGGSSGGYSSHGRTSHASLRAYGDQIIDVGKSELLPITKCGRLCGSAVVFCLAAVVAIIGKEEQRLITNLIHCH